MKFGVLLAVLFLAYLIGSFPFGLLVGKLAGIDIRKYGSGNIGATNIYRVLGPVPGLVVLMADFLKGALAILTTKLLLGSQPLLITLVAMAVILGHSFSLFLKFKGGKGVATTAGVLLGINFSLLVICLVIFLLIVITTRYVSLGSIMVAVLVPFLILFARLPSPYFVLGLFIAFLISWQHKENIKRLLKGYENKI